MDDKTIKNAEQAANDNFDRAYACPADSDDYLKLINSSARLLEIVNEQEKLKHDIQLKEKELDENKKTEYLKLGVQIIAPILTTVLMMTIDQRNWMSRARVISVFETNQNWTSSAGRALAQSLKIPGVKV